MSRKILEFGDFDKLNIDYLSVSYTMTQIFDWTQILSISVYLFGRLTIC